MADHRVERRGLGRGLSALMADVTPIPERAEESRPRRAEREVPVERLHANPDQPRRTFNEVALEELAASIRERGIIQPLIVRASPRREGDFEIVAGERRWRAAQRAQLHQVPVIVREFTDTEVMEVAIVENIQRADLNAIEEAQAYQQLIDRFGHTQDQLGTALGKSRSHIANLLRLLNLPEEVRELVITGALSAGHARALITAADPVGLARQVVAKGLSVRETERLAKVVAGKSGVARDHSGRSDKDADTRALEGDLSAALGLKVAIEHGADGRGSVTIRYGSLEELDDLCNRMSRAGR